jgi:hypothetical protein
MTLLLDARLWIDFTRRRSPVGLKQFIAPFIHEHAESFRRDDNVRWRYDVTLNRTSRSARERNWNPRYGRTLGG